MAPAKKPFKIKRPGALSAQQRPGETMSQTAERLRASGTPLQKREADFYLNVLRPAAENRKKSSPGSEARRAARKTEATRKAEHRANG